MSRDGASAPSCPAHLFFVAAGTTGAALQRAAREHTPGQLVSTPRGGLSVLRGSERKGNAGFGSCCLTQCPLSSPPRPLRGQPPGSDTASALTGHFALSTEVTLKNIPHFQPPWEKHFLGHRNQCCSEALLVGTTKQIQVTSSAEKPRVIPTENLRVCHVTPRQLLCFPTRTNGTLQEVISGAILIL